MLRSHVELHATVVPMTNIDNYFPANLGMAPVPRFVGWQYSCIARRQLVGVLLAVYVHERLKPLVRNVQVPASQHSSPSPNPRAPGPEPPAAQLGSVVIILGS